jgi:ABC-2 type transport system ATP-binding protein
MIQINHLSVNFGKKKALDNLNLNIQKGESVLLAGAIGSVKTTLLRCMANVLFPQKGQILINNRKIGSSSQEITAYIPASISFYDGLKVKEAIRFHGSFFPNFSYLGIGEFALDQNRRIATLSKGEKTLFFLSLALSIQPEYLLIDDVIHFLDPHLREYFLKSILQLIEENQLSVIVAAQSSFEIEGIFDRLVLMDKGKVVINEPVDELKKKIVKIYSDRMPAKLPVVFQKTWESMSEIFIYPYTTELKVEEKIHYVSLSEILRAFIGGEYGSH